MSLRFLCLASLAAAACTTHPSDEILTRGIYAEIAAQATGDGTTSVGATLYLDNPANLDFVEVTGDDRLVAWSSVSADQQDMDETQILGITSYNTYFSYDDEGTEFHVGFLRTVDDGAPDSVATLPPAFEVTSDLGTTQQSRASELAVTWDPPGDNEMTWQASGDCIETANGTFGPDDGSGTIAAGTLQKQGDTADPDTCSVTLSLTRSLPGDLDPGYGHGGTVAGLQVRSVMFTTAP